MAKIKGMCRNEDCEMCDQIQEAEKSNFKCEKCGKDLIPFGNNTSEPGGRINKKLFGIIASIFVLLAIIGSIFALKGNKSETPKQLDVVVVDSDSIRAAQLEEQRLAEQQRVQDSLKAVADSLTRVADEARIAAQKTQESTQTSPAPAKPVTPRATSGSKDLGYATFKGSWPNDVNGRLIFKSSHLIDSRDPKSRMAEPGDYVIGEFADGHLVQGIWYGSDNTVKGSIIIGK